MTVRYREHMHSDELVHTWPLPLPHLKGLTF